MLKGPRFGWPTRLSFAALTSSQVPTVAQYTEADNVLAQTMADIKAQWACSQGLHGETPCVDARGVHIVVHRVCWRQWAARIVGSFTSPSGCDTNKGLQKGSGKALTVDMMPPDDLLESWGVNAARPPRGRTGPHAQYPQPAATSSQDQTAMLTTALVAAVTDSLIRRRSPSPRSPSKRPRRSPSSSPPPPVGEELKVFLDSCIEKVRLSQDVMDGVFHVLDEEGYTPEALGHRNLDQGKIARLTGLREGAVMSIHAHAEE